MSINKLTREEKLEIEKKYSIKFNRNEWFTTNACNYADINSIEIDRDVIIIGREIYKRLGNPESVSILFSEDIKNLAIIKTEKGHAVYKSKYEEYFKIIAPKRLRFFQKYIYGENEITWQKNKENFVSIIELKKKSSKFESDSDRILKLIDNNKKGNNINNGLS